MTDRSRGKTCSASISLAWSATISLNLMPSLLTFRTCRFFCNAELAPQIWSRKRLTDSVFRTGIRFSTTAFHPLGAAFAPTSSYFNKRNPDASISCSLNPWGTNRKRSIELRRANSSLVTGPVTTTGSMKIARRPGRRMRRHSSILSIDRENDSSNRCKGPRRKNCHRMATQNWHRPP